MKRQRPSQTGRVTRSKSRKTSTQSSTKNDAASRSHAGTTTERTVDQSASSQSLPKDETGLTFRLLRVPIDWEKQRLESFLADQDGFDGPNVRSLAVEIEGGSKTATVSFDSVPRRTGEDWEFPLPTDPTQSTNPRPLVLNDDFLGITTLFAPPSEDHKVEIVAISGLGGHVFGSFRDKKNKHHMWLRDALPHDLTGAGDNRPLARVMVYGYESKLANSDSMQNLEDLATTFQTSLRMLVAATKPKPIVLVAHSLGGLVVKQALIAISGSKNEEDMKLIKAVYGIVFFGVPHDGMDITSLIPMVGDGPNRPLLHSIDATNSQTLSTQQREFLKALGNEGDSEIVCFYETCKSPTATKVKGQWKMKGKPAILVNKISATHCRPWEDGPEHNCAINRTHSEMVKFRLEDPDYKNALQRIKGISQRAMKRLLLSRPLLSESAQKCLQSLAFKEIDDRSNDIEDAVTGTCRWLHQHMTYKNWVASRQGLLWIKGKPGSGKSTLLKYIFKNHSAGDNDLVLSFFFHGRGDELQKTPLGFLRSLLHQVLGQVPDSLQELVELYNKKCQQIGSGDESWQWHKNELLPFLKSSISNILNSRSIWIFIDALDECGKENAIDLAEKLKLLFDDLSSADTQFHICFTCRHYPILNSYCKFEISVDQENGRDISTVVYENLSTLPEPISAISDLITKRASGVFMWAHFVVKQVLSLNGEGFTFEEIKAAVHSIPPDLNEIYKSLVETMEPNSLKLIQWLCFATRPLSLDELRWAMVVDPKCPYKSLRECQGAKDYEPDNARFMKRVQTLSCGLAEVTSSPNSQIVQFIHQSVKDFFLENSSRLPSPQLSNYRLSRICIRYLAMVDIKLDFFDSVEEAMLKGYIVGQNAREKARNQMKSDYPFLYYATTSWLLHIEEGNGPSIPQDLLEYFGWPSNLLLEQWIRFYDIMDTSSLHCPVRGTRMLHIVSRYQYLVPLQMILQKAYQVGEDIDSKDQKGRTPLWCAAYKGHEAIIKQLYDLGADPDSKDQDGQTPLWWAAREGHEAIVKQLYDLGADPDLKDQDGQTPLWWAAFNGHEAIVKLLCDVGADPDSKDQKGRTPLSWAAKYGHGAVVKLLETVRPGD